MKEDIRGFVITSLNEGKPIKIEMNDEQRKKIEESSKKVVQPEVFLIEFIGKENFDRAEIAMDNALDKSLPKGLIIVFLISIQTQPLSYNFFMKRLNGGIVPPPWRDCPSI